MRAQFKPGLLPLLGFTGPDCRLNLNQDMSNRITSATNAKLHIDAKQLIYWAATGVATARAALGSDATIVPSIWPRYWAPSGVRLPWGSAALPKLFMRDYCNGILDAGANGVSCWTPTFGPVAERQRAKGDNVLLAGSRRRDPRPPRQGGLTSAGLPRLSFFGNARFFASPVGHSYRAPDDRSRSCGRCGLWRNLPDDNSAIAERTVVALPPPERSWLTLWR